MVSTSQNANPFGGNLIHESMLIVDSLQPAPRKLMLKRLRLANASERIALRLLD
jgi:hypothetical protein